MNQNKLYPNISQAIVVIIAVMLLQVVLGVPLAIVALVVKGSKEGAETFIRHPAVLAVINIMAFGVVLVWGLRKSRSSFRETFPFTSLQPTLLVPMGLTVIGMSILVSAADNLLRVFWPVPPEFAEFLRNIIGTQSSLWGTILIAVIVAPLSEEFLFRGLILRGLLSQYSVTTAVIVSSLLFGIIHLNPWQMLGATVLGTVFAWWYVKTRSLWPCIFGHALNNALPIIYGRILQLKIPGYTDESLEQLQFQPMWFNALGLLLVGAGLWLTMQMFGKREETPDYVALANQVE